VKNLRLTEIAVRLREIRSDWYGEQGAQFFADGLGIPLRTWLNYESGIVVPGEIVLKIIDMTHVNPRWLLTGQGAKFDR